MKPRKRKTEPGPRQRPREETLTEVRKAIAKAHKRIVGQRNPWNGK